MGFETSEHIDSAYFRGTSALKCGSMLSFVFSMLTESGKDGVLKFVENLKWLQYRW